MTTGAIFPSYGDGVVWSAVSGGWTESYPLQNVADRIRASNVGRASAAGARVITGVLSEKRVIAAVAIIGHNLPVVAGAIQVWAFSGTGTDPVANAGEIVFNSGPVSVWPSGSGPISPYRSIRPFLFSGVQARSFRIAFPAGPEALEIEAIEVGGFWEWPGVSFGREQGFAAGGSDVALVGGGAQPGDGNPARSISAQLDFMAMATTSTTGLDFQKRLDVQTPFVWSDEYENPAQWPRKVLLVRNESLPAIVGRLYRHDAFPVRLVEHLR